MAASTYSETLKGRVDALLRSLVSCAAKLRPGDPNFSLALTYVSWHTHRHPFPDTDAKAVARDAAGWEARFDAAAQLDKRDRFATLTDRLLALPLAGEAPARVSAAHPP